MSKQKMTSILGFPIEGNDPASLHKNLYASWRETSSQAGMTFMQLYSPFKDQNILAKIDGGALKLYLYFCYSARNKTGESWWSVDRIQEYFGKEQKRTIEKWLKNLTDFGLISRMNDGKRKTNTTFLLPFCDTMMKLRDPKPNGEGQELVTDLITRVRGGSEAYGEIVNVFHLFQWSKGVKGRQRPHTQWLLIITVREVGAPTSKVKVFIGHYYKFSSLGEMVVSEPSILDLSRFQSPFQWEGRSIQGIGVKDSLRLNMSDKTAMKNWLSILPDLGIREQAEIDRLDELVYGHAADVLPLEAESEEDASEMPTDHEEEEENESQPEE